MSSILLFIVGALHLVRAFLGRSMIINDRMIPLWVSIVGGVVLLGLSYKLRHHERTA